MIGGTTGLVWGGRGKAKSFQVKLIDEDIKEFSHSLALHLTASSLRCAPASGSS